MARSHARGFTLVELVMVIAVTGVIAAVAGRIIAHPVQAYLDTTRRADLVEAAQLTLHRITRESRLALPNSVRTSADGTAVEFLRVRTGGRYRAEGPGTVLDFALSTGSFDVIGVLPDASGVDVGAGATLADCVAGTVDCLVVYNTGQSGADAYALDNVAAVRTVSGASISYSRPTPFPIESPAQRFYVIDSPVSYLCDTATGRVRRYDGYPLTALHSDADTHAELVALGAFHSLASDRVTDCEFMFQPGTATRSGLLTARISLAEAGESISLVHQSHVRNLP